MKGGGKKEVWVFVEADTSGRPRKTSFQLFTVGREIAAQTKGQLVAICAGLSEENNIHQTIGLRADRILMLKGLPPAPVTWDQYIQAFTHLLGKYDPFCLLMTETEAGRDLAPGIAARMDVMLAAGCDQVRLKAGDQLLTWRRRSFGGDLVCDFTGASCNAGIPLQIGTIRPGAYPTPPESGRKAEVVFEEIPQNVVNQSIKLPELIKINAAPAANLGDARVIVAGGRGAGGPEGFRLISKLAEALNGEIAASRVAADKGWIEKSRLVGQSGKTVKPDLYIACGISGSVQHITGMRDSGCIVSINTDPQAQIFGISDYCVVGDMFEIIPAWLEELGKKEEQRKILY